MGLFGSVTRCERDYPKLMPLQARNSIDVARRGAMRAAGAAVTVYRYYLDARDRAVAADVLHSDSDAEARDRADRLLAGSDYPALRFGIESRSYIARGRAANSNEDHGLPMPVLSRHRLVLHPPGAASFREMPILRTGSASARTAASTKAVDPTASLPCR